MELVLPQNYVEIEQEEMVYLEGGLSLYKWVVSAPINMAFNALLGGGTISLLRGYIARNGKTIVKNEIFNVTKKWLGVRAANYITGTIVGNLLKFSGWMSVGDVVANLWDSYDLNPNNNRLNWFW
ncbi:hypothetical protein [Helcococcus massiliensis]|uniref:hypothetical protein n=1 Tax=Helcococcus massiliensis TaxID=2040290 RepID=UPI000CDE55FF|nr:hypothetical protein [Helcococcus massiliensis]